MMNNSHQIATEEPKPLRNQQEALDLALQMVGKACGMKLQAAPEDRYRIAIVEACQWLRNGAPGRALEVLEDILSRKF